MPEHRDRPASDLARGPAKSDDIERARRDVDEADAQSVRAEEVSVARHRQRVSSRVAESEEKDQT
jgi:hypothetical protein